MDDYKESKLYGTLENIIEFSKNVEKIKPGSNLHNVYVITLTDDTGNEEVYYGCNLMTDYYFTGKGYGRAYDNGNDRYIYIGNGIDANHQPSYDNHTMFNRLSVTIKTNTRLDDELPMFYDSTTHKPVSTVRIHRTQYDYNNSNVQADVICNEIGYGTSSTELFSHSKIYDENGNEKTITKRINQSMTIELYWRISIDPSIFSTLWSQGIYGMLRPKVLLWTRNNDAITLYENLAKSAGAWLTNCADSYNYWTGFLTDTRYYTFNGSYTDQNRYGTVTYDATTHTETWSTNSTSTSYRKFLMEARKRDFFGSIEVFTYWWNNCNVAQSMVQGLYFNKPYKMSTAEDITAFIRTNHFDDVKFDEIIGKHPWQGGGSYGNINEYGVKMFRGYLPILDMDIRSLCRYNFETDDWDIPVTYNNPVNNDYDWNMWFKPTYLYVRYPDNVARSAFVYVNRFAGDSNIATKIVGFKNGGTLNYATDTWWDPSSWEPITNYATIDPELQDKKYYITNKKFEEGLNSGDIYTLSWWQPIFDFENGVHGIQNVPAKRVFSNYYKSTAGIDMMRTDEINDYMVYDNTCIYKMSEGVLVNWYNLIYNHFSDYFSSPYSNPSYSSYIYLDNGKVVMFLYSYYNSNTRQSDYYNQLGFFTLDLSEASADIENSLTFKHMNSEFSNNNAKDTNTVIFKVGSKYIAMMPTVTVDTGYECLIYDTETDSTWMIPDKLPRTIVPVYGRNEIVAAPGGDLSRFTIYDVSTQTVVDEFEISSDYSPISNMMFAFDDFVYILCQYGSNETMLLYNRLDQTLKSITYPTDCVKSNLSCGFGTWIAAPQYSPYHHSTVSWYSNICVQYMDGIVAMTTPRDGASGASGSTEYPLLIFSKYNPESIIRQYMSVGYSSSYDTASLVDIVIHGMCIKHMYGSYYLFTHGHGNYWAYTNNTFIFDIGRIVRTNSAINNNSGEFKYTDLACVNRNGMYAPSNQSTQYYYCKFTPYNNKIYAMTQEYDTSHTYELPFDGFITYKVNLKTKTCSRWNNPKLITLPPISLSFTNRV